jgi:two-component system sensor histidine kinase FlrB
MGVTALLESNLNYKNLNEVIDKALGQEEQGDSVLEESISENRLKTLLKALPAGVIVLDGQGKVQECNPAAIELLDEPLLGLEWRAVINRAFDPERISGQDSVTRKGRIVSISTCPLGEGVPGQIVLLQDVTEKHQLQSRLEQQSRLASMGKMAAQLAHQIRTPISAALLYASHLKSPRLDEQKRLRFAEKILTRIQSLEQLINDMLLFSRNGMENRESISVEQLLNELSQSIEKPNNKENVKLSFRYMLAEPYYISGNRNLLISGLSNIVNNALYAVESDGEISVKVSQPIYGSIDISVQDNGKGIDADSIDKIFQPFYTTKEQGTGLGLAVVKAIANAHNGELWLDSTDTSGTTFRMRLPIQIQTLNQNHQQQE